MVLIGEQEIGIGAIPKERLQFDEDGLPNTNQYYATMEEKVFELVREAANEKGSRKVELPDSYSGRIYTNLDKPLSEKQILSLAHEILGLVEVENLFTRIISKLQRVKDKNSDFSDDQYEYDDETIEELSATTLWTFLQLIEDSIGGMD